jgi:hypothetical protein
MLGALSIAMSNPNAVFAFAVFGSGVTVMLFN